MGHNGAVVTKKSGHGLGPTRARVLRFLLAQHEPRAVADLADALALHPNTIRFHLEALVSLGYVSEEQDKDRKSTRLNSSHVASSYAVFFLKNKMHLQSTSQLPS